MPKSAGRDRTLVVFTADHGGYMGFHHMRLKGGYTYDPLVRVPLIVRWPGGRQAATVDDRLVSLQGVVELLLVG